MPLNEFIKLPTTVPFYAWYTPTFQDFLNQRPYIRLSKILMNEIAILYAPENYMPEIFKDLGSDFLNLYPEIYGLTGKEALDAAGITSVQNQPYLKLTGQGTIIGIVDTGIDYTLPVFRYEDGTTKIKYIWDQTIETYPSHEVNFGTVYTQDQINEALRSENPFDIVPHKDEVGHGTFLASVAAGKENKEDDFIGAAPDAELIVVKLKKAGNFYREKFLVPKNQENAFESTDIMLGLAFIFQQSSILKLPAVACLGLGTNFGGHNGKNRLEQYISFISNIPGVAVCTGVGNESNARHHTEGLLAKNGDEKNISIRVGDDADSLSVYIWYEGWDKISFSLKSPTGEIINRIPFFAGTSYEKKLIIESSTVRILYHQNESRFALIQILDVVPGTWEITLHGDVIISGKYHAWLPMTGFISPSVEFISPTPNYTTVIPSTSQGSVSVGAYNNSNNSLYINSSWGPAANSFIVPDFAAPGVSIEGYYSYGKGTMTGTSASAAITAGASALMFQWAIGQGNAPVMTGNRLRTVLIRACNRDTTREYPNPQWGYGTLDLIEAFNLFRED
ncbi:MAG: S8 family peptidase [Acutalibacteraceae bacterium]